LTLLALAAFGSTIAPSLLFAQSSQSGLSAVQIFSLADQAKSEGRFADAETMYDALSKDPDAEVRAEARFRKGMMLADLGRLVDAATAFRALLDEKPDSPRVRLELARVLALMGDETGARRQVRQAQAAGLPAEVAVVVDQFANALRSRKSIGGSVEFALMPDSNINRATDAKTLDTILAPLNLSEDAQSQSGIGAKIAGQVYARHSLGPGIALLGRANAQAELYGKSQFNDVSASALIGPEFLLPKDRIRPAAGLTYRFYGQELYARTVSATVNWLHSAGRVAQIDTTATVSRNNYALNDLQDGWMYDVNTSYERAFTARSGGSLALSINRQTARDPGYATTSGGLTALSWRDMGKMTVFASVGVRHLEADARLFLFKRKRSEYYYRATIGASFRQAAVAGFAPVIRAVAERNFSTVGIYDYSRIGLEFGLTRAF
jgi:tetratricopeptide (TPR) repeat protein